MDYRSDIVNTLKREADLIKKQTMLEVISVVTACDTFDEFKKAMYGMALEYFREMEKEGLVAKGTVDRLIANPTEPVVPTKSESEMTDDMFLI